MTEIRNSGRDAGMDLRGEGFQGIAHSVWEAWQLACTDASHPLRTAVFGTVAAGTVALRTMILRRTDSARRRLAFCTDVRSGKLAQLRAVPNAECLFHDPRSKLQIRASGIVTIHHRDDFAMELWEATPAASRLNYCGVHAPGTTISNPGAALPPAWRNGVPERMETETGYANFGILEMTVDAIEWLQLNSPVNRRAALHWVDGVLEGRWLAP